MTAVRVGVACQDVMVPVGTPMAGFAARLGPSTGVHDLVTVRALAFDGGVALVSVDVCSLHERTCEKIRAVAGNHVIVTATHTHSGPCVSFERLGTHAEGVHDAIVAAALAAVSEARASAVPCRMLYGEASGGGVAKNRRHPDRVIDPPVQILAFAPEKPIGPADEAAHYLAHLITYPCHPVVLDGLNRQISGDYPAFLRAGVEETFPGSVCIFATGCAGDVNTGHSAAASFTPTGGGMRTFAEAKRIGALLARAVAGATMQELPTSAVQVDHGSVALPLQMLTEETVRTQRAEWARQLDEASDPGLRMLLELWIAWADAWEPGYQPEWPARISLLTIGEVSIVALPGEPFWATACRICEQGTGPTLVLGYADGVPGYIPPADECQYGGYEVCDAHRYYAMPAPFAAGAADRLEQAVEVLDAAARHHH
ncbi:alkaline ceramidase [Propionimicrobium sp. PCR01-08-3]|uniref:alkaline ceramidase n=1 Tax=Propionimicrobium sp. PCR01-08-3 TaxID=3052086 RepID=UPI00255CD530|nr:alkaline ceramidase [Propionimicrobium sp. PCR01-08-3]WIY81699.1 alkaline ceramidase [Propionimicrobium sp. PCR01-08-3]